MGGVFQRDDLGAVVGAGLGRLAEGQFVALNLRRGSQDDVMGLDYSAPLWANHIILIIKNKNILICIFLYKERWHLA